MVWGWRIPFLLSIVLLAVGWYIRARLPETRPFEELKARGGISKNPFLEASAKDPNNILIALGLAGVSVLAVMVVQFESFVEPLVIVLAAPVSFVGALALLLVTGTPLNVSSFMGMILLVGLIVKNGIILLDFTRHRMREGGLPLEPAIREAARVRLRPILMTTLCTLFGLLPLALGLGAGSELQRPLALAVIGGLTLSTPITLFAIPTLLVAIRGRDYRPDDRAERT